MGVYNTILEAYSKDGKQPNFGVKASMGMFAGAIGAFFGSPAEITLIRMTSDGRLPAAERRNYKNVVNALTRIATEEGKSPEFGQFSFCFSNRDYLIL